MRGVFIYNIPCISLWQVAREVSRALSHVVSCLPGQRIVDDAIDDITAAIRALQDPNLRVSITFLNVWTESFWFWSIYNHQQKQTE